MYGNIYILLDIIQLIWVHNKGYSVIYLLALKCSTKLFVNICHMSVVTHEHYLACVSHVACNQHTSFLQGTNKHTSEIVNLAVSCTISLYCTWIVKPDFLQHWILYAGKHPWRKTFTFEWKIAIRGKTLTVAFLWLILLINKGMIHSKAFTVEWKTARMENFTLQTLSYIYGIFLCVEELTCCEANNFDMATFSMWELCFGC